MAINQLSSPRQAAFGFGWLSWTAYHLFSLETFLILFLYAAHLKALLPPTPIPETVFYGVVSIAIGLWIVLREGIYRGGLPVVIAGLALTGWMFISYGWSPSRTLARENLPFVIVINVWALFAAACIVAGSRERVLRFLLLLMVLAAVLGTVGSYIYMIHGDFRFYRGPYGEWHHRTYLAWGNIAMSGASVALALTLYARFGSARQLAAAAIFGACMYFLMINGARGALLGSLLAFSVAFISSPPRINDGRLSISRAQILAFFMLGIIFVYIIYIIYNEHGTATISRFMSLFSQAEDPLIRSGANRFDYFYGAYQAWLNSPIFGQGLSGFSIFFCGFDQSGCHPHNIFLQSLADHGLIGGILLVVFILLGIRHFSLAQLHRDPLRTAVLMVFMTILVYVLVAAELPTAHRFFFFVGLLAMRPPSDETDKLDATDDP